MSSTYLVFVTPTQVDLRELFTLGLGSKRGVEGKIGHKGSGMKFTLALLHRLGSHLQIEVNGRTWTSSANTVQIRDVDHSLIYLVDRSGELPAIECSISVNAGADTWNQPWFALRELLQNCIDEGGFFREGDDLACHDFNSADGTVMRVLLTDQLRAEWEGRSRWFNPRHSEIIYVSEQPGLYYHGFLVFQSSEWKYSYDVTDILSREQLSEDRQLRNTEMTRLFRLVFESAPSIPAAMYADMVRPISADDVEYLRDAAYYASDDDRPNPGAFKSDLLADAFFAAHGAKACRTLSRQGGPEWYYATAEGYTPIQVNYNLYHLLGYGKRVPAAENLIPSLVARLKQVKPTDLNSTALDRLKEALRLTKRLRPDGCKVEIVTKQFTGDSMRAGALADIPNNRVLILQSHVEDNGVSELTETLVEEFMHLRSGESDVTLEFQRALIRQIAVLLQPRKRATSMSL